MRAVSTFAKKIVLAAAVSAMLPVGFACAASQTAQAPAIAYRQAENAADEFLGFWEEALEGEIRLTVTKAEKGWYGVEVSHRRNERQVDMWTMTAKPAGDHVMQYTDGNHILLTYGPQYIEKEEFLYRNGTGTIRMVGPKQVKWQDDQDHKADDVLFIPLRSPLGGGL